VTFAVAVENDVETEQMGHKNASAAEQEKETATTGLHV